MTDRRADLEAAIEAKPDDDSVYQVYADYLQEVGDPRGELIALQLDERSKDVIDRAQRLIEKHAFGFGALVKDVFWRWGFAQSVCIEPGAATGPALRAVLDHPSARFLCHLEVRNSDHGLQTTIDALAHRVRPCLVDLSLGAFRDGVDGSTIIGDSLDVGSLDRLWPALPRLRSLSINGQNFSFGTIEAPAMRWLEVSSIALRSRALQELARASWSALETLDLRFGHSEPTRAELDQLLFAPFPALDHLGLDGNFIDELIQPLAAMPILRQLRTLQLSGGMTDRGAEQLARHADAFAHLEKLDLAWNYLSANAVRTLGDIAKVVDTKDQREPPEHDPDLYDY